MKELLFNMRRWLVTSILVVVLISFGYLAHQASKHKKIPTNDYVSRIDSQNYWIKAINIKNPELHDAIVAAMLLSKDTSKEIFVLRNSEGGKLKYRLSTNRGNADNILSYSHKDRYISFDHYNVTDGPLIETTSNQLLIERKLDSYYQELGIK